MVVSYELDRVGRRGAFMASTVGISVVPISFVWKVNNFVKYLVTVSSGDWREAECFHQACVQPSLVKALSCRSLSASHIATGWVISSMSERSVLQHPSSICASAQLAW